MAGKKPRNDQDADMAEVIAGAMAAKIVHR